MRLVTIAVLVLLVGAAGTGAWWRFGQVDAVTLVPARTGTAAEILYASGVVEPVTWAKVTPLVRERILEVCNCEGEVVEAGDLLVRLDDNEVQARQRELEARRALAMREMQRASDLLERSVGSEQDYDRAASELAQVEASLAAVVEQANDHRVTAPIAGQVLRLDASVGEIADPAQALAYVGQARPLEVVAEVNEEDIPRVSTGQKVLMRSDAFGGRVLEGSVGRITPMGDPVQKTYRVRIALPEDTPLFIGMSVDANIVIRENPGAVLVPVAALSGERVFVVEGGVLAARDLRLGIRGLETAEVLEGLAAGEAVVSPLPEDAEAGLRVRVAGEAGG